MDGARLDAIRGIEGLGSRTDPESRKAVAREFEALLVGEMTKIANKPVFGEPVLGGGSSSRMWQELFLEQVVRQGAGRFGIADSAFPTGQSGAKTGDGASERPETPGNVTKIAPEDGAGSRSAPISESALGPSHGPERALRNEVPR